MAKRLRPFILSAGVPIRRCHFHVLSAVWIALFMFPCLVFGQTGMDQIGSARGVALGHAVTADPFSLGLHVNPAAPAASDRKAATFFARQPFGLAELRHASTSASLALPWFSIQGGAGTFGFEAYRETFAAVGVSRSVPVGASLPIYVGVRAALHHLSISDYGSDEAVTADAGLLVPVLPVLTLGVHARNVAGGSIAESPLPRSLAVGLHYSVGPQVHILADVLKDVAHPWSIRGGVEVRPVNVLSLRVGATRHPARFTAGAGINLGRVRADIAAERHPTLGWSPSGGLILSF